MATRWIVVAHSAEAKIYATDKVGREPVVWRTLEHPASRRKDIDLVADRPGRTFDSAGQGRHAMATRHTPKDRESDIFAAEISELLEYGRTRSLYDELVLIAPPRFSRAAAQGYGRRGSQERRYGGWQESHRSGYRCDLPGSGTSVLSCDPAAESWLAGIAWGHAVAR